MNNGQINTQKRDARVAGYLYLIIIIVGMYGFAYALPQIIVQGNISETLNNVSKSEPLFRLVIFSILLMNVVSIVLAAYLYKLLSLVNKNMATIMLVFLAIGAGVSMLNEVNHFAILIFLVLMDCVSTYQK